MLIATFGPGTGWAGKTIDYQDGIFTLQDFGRISAADVIAYDRQTPLVWGYEGLKGWVASQAPATPLPAGASAHSTQKKSFPTWAIILIALAVVVTLIAAVYLPAKAGVDDQNRASAVQEGIHSLQIGVQSYAVDNQNAYPPPSMVNEAGMMTYVDIWPTNPYTNGPMVQGTDPGQFSYMLNADGSFEIVGYGRGGPVLTVP